MKLIAIAVLLEGSMAAALLVPSRTYPNGDWVNFYERTLLYIVPLLAAGIAMEIYRYDKNRSVSSRKL